MEIIFIGIPVDLPSILIVIWVMPEIISVMTLLEEF
jgi:hypothetical protein